MQNIKISKELLAIGGLTLLAILIVKGFYLSLWQQTAEQWQLQTELEQHLADPSLMAQEIKTLTLRKETAVKLLTTYAVPLPDQSHEWTQWISEQTLDAGLILQRLSADTEAQGWQIHVSGSTEALTNWLYTVESALPPGCLRKIHLFSQPEQGMEIFIAWSPS